MFLSAASTIADAAATRVSLAYFLQPAVIALTSIGILIAAAVIVHGGISMSTSSGNPTKLAEAKHSIRKGITGLVVVLLAGTLLSLLTNSYASTNQTGIGIQTPVVRTIAPSTSNSIVDVIIGSILGILRSVIDGTYGFAVSVVTQLITHTPILADIPAVFNLWIGVLGLADALFILVIILLGYRIMTGSALGLENISLKSAAPKLVIGFLVMNCSLFFIDALISLANAMTDALEAGFKYDTVWNVLSTVLATNGSLQLPALIILFIFVALTFFLCIYYIMRLIVLFVGAVLSPLIVILYMLPPFKEFAATAARTYLTTIFILFLHVIILTLASSLFIAMSSQLSGNTMDPLLAGILGIATLLSILKIQHVVNQMSFVSSGVNNARRLGTTFAHGVGSLRRSIDRPVATPSPIKSNIVTITKVVE